MTRFWIMELQGKKLVRLLPPSEFARAHASDHADYCPTLFSVDLMDPNFEKFPEADGMLVYEALLEPGDVLFIPEGWGHKCASFLIDKVHARHQLIRIFAVVPLLSVAAQCQLSLKDHVNAASCEHVHTRTPDDVG